MDLQMTQVLGDEKPAGADDDGLQVGILRVGTTEHSVVKGFTKIGRHPKCEIIIDDLSVSKVHAEIQAGCEAVFISDQRSANGTKIKDVSLKPFFYYTINDGDAIYIGTVKAIFSTNKSPAHSPAVVPETPTASRWLSEASTPGVGNTSDCLFNNSSVCQSDDSVVPGTARKEKSRIFQQPAVPVARRSGGSNVSPLRFRVASEVSRSDKTGRFAKSEKLDIAKKSQIAAETDIHDLETQLIETGSRSPKKAHSKGHTQDVADENIHDAETQIVLRPAENEGSAKKEKSNKSRINDTTASSSRCYDSSSNFSRELQMSTSPSPPGSPNPFSNSADIDLSQDLLELCETPLLPKKTTSPANSATKASPIATRVTTNQKKPVVPNRVIADSDDESATDDDMDIDIIKARPEVAKGNASDTIDDESATDDEGEFEALAKKSPKGAPKISSEIQKPAPTDSVNPTDIFDALTQRMDQEAPGNSSAPKANIFKGAKQLRDQIRLTMAQNRNKSVPDIFEAETQQLDCHEDSAVAATTTERRDRGSIVDRDDDVNIYDAPTQRMVEEDPVVTSAKNSRNPPKDDDYDTDIDLLPTQVLNVQTSTPATRSRRSNRRNLEKSPRLDVDDGIYLAPTQIVSDADAVADKNDGERSAVDGPSLGVDESIKIQVTNSSPARFSLKLKKQNTKRSPLVGAEEDANSAEASGRSEENGVTGRKGKKRPAESDKEDENTGLEKDQCPVNLDETLVRNLGMIHGEEANDRHLAEESTPLMTQNLVDILKPTQSCDSESRDTSDEIVGDVCEPPTPKKRKLGSPETAAIVQAANRSRWSNALPAASSTMREANSEDEKETKDASEARELSEWEDPDSILYGLPPFEVFDSLSNPGSPCPSTTSNHSNIVAPARRESAKTGRKNVSPGPTESPRSRKSVAATKSPEPDSPVVEKKSRVGRRKAPRKIIEEEEEEKDQDSDEAYCYNDLKKMADDLLASGSVESTSRPDDNVAAAVEPENFSSTGRPVRHVRKIVTRKNVAVSRQRTRKLPQAPSSLLVTDAKSSTRVNDESTDSSSVGASRKSSRLPKSTKSVTSMAKVAATKQGKESQEVEEILAATPKGNVSSASSRKESVPKVQLTRMDNSNSPSPTIGGTDYESPKARWMRRATMTATELTPTSGSPGSAKGRRTISEGVKQETPKEQHNILITGLTEDYSKVVKKLGGTVVSVPSKATVLITDKVRRTYKFLCAIAQGMRVVSINWLLESKKAARFLDCDDFILKDPAAEKRYKFQLEKTLQIARTKKFLEGYTIIITPKVNQPEVSELKAMIEASGGRALTRAPAVRAWNSKTVIVSREEYVTAINALLAKCPKTIKVTVQSTEFILSGILRQEVNLVEHKLDIP